MEYETIRYEPGPNSRQEKQAALNDARRAIAEFIEQHAGQLTVWLGAVANGVVDETGRVVVPPNPKEAFQLFQSMVEYHIPKLQRSEIKSENTHSVQGLTDEQIASMTTDDLKKLILKSVA